MDLGKIDQLCAEQGARVSALKREAADKHTIDVAVAELLKLKTTLALALEQAISNTQDEVEVAALQERLSVVTPKSKSPQKQVGVVAPAPATPVSEPAPFNRAAEWDSFLTVRKNRDACIHWILRLAQTIERVWDKDLSLR